jgi:hypothetical protein
MRGIGMEMDELKWSWVAKLYFLLFRSVEIVTGIVKTNETVSYGVKPMDH